MRDRESERERERKRDSRVDGVERDRREKLMNNTKREEHFLKMYDEEKRKSGAASRSNRIHSILFCLIF